MKNIMDDILLRDVDNALGEMDAPTRLRSIGFYNGSTALSPEAPYDHDASSELPSFPTVFVIHDQGESYIGFAHILIRHLVGNGGGVSHTLHLKR